MKKEVIVLVMIFTLFYSCKESQQEVIESFNFAVFDDKSVFIDEYMYKNTGKIEHNLIR